MVLPVVLSSKQADGSVEFPPHLLQILFVIFSASFVDYLKGAVDTENIIQICFVNPLQWYESQTNIHPLYGGVHPDASS